jgi:hypothetical protein
MPRVFLVALFAVAACGGSKSSPATPSPPPPNAPGSAASEDSAAYGGLEGPAGSAASAPAKPAAGRALTLREAPGPIAGLPGYAVRHTPDPSYCGGIRVTIDRPSGTPSALDQPFVDALALEFPGGLDFEGNRDAAMKKFQAFMQQIKDVGDKAQKHYLVVAEHGGLEGKLTAMARMAQISFRLGSLIARAPIPADLARGPYAADKIDAYCDHIVEIGVALEHQGLSLVSSCAQEAARAQRGWWIDVCRP